MSREAGEDGMLGNLKKGLNLLNRSQRQSLLLLLILMLIVALLETLGIGLLMPYIGVVNSPELITSNRNLRALYLGLGFESFQKFIIAASLVLILIFIVKNAVYIAQQYIQSRNLLKLQLDIETRLMSGYMSREYLFFTEKNPAELYQNIRSVSGIVGLIYTPALTLASELIVLLLVGVFLVLVQPLVTFAAVGVSGVLAYFIYRFNRKRAPRYGDEVVQNLIEMDKWMYQSFAGIKEIKILSKEKFFLDRSIFYSRAAAWAGMKVAMLSAITRPFIETVWFSLTVLLVLISILAGKNGSTMLPVIVLLAAAAIRIMPALNRILNATISIRQATHHVSAVTNELERKLVATEHEGAHVNEAAEFGFMDEIKFENVAFGYPGSTVRVLENISFTIKKGHSVAFVGPSGSGKTTAVDLLLGLIEPQKGQIFVDGFPLTKDGTRSWRNNFGYVPQSIYLSDDTIKNNIAFGQAMMEINVPRIKAVIEQAQLTDVLERLPHGLDTEVGDRGARLSGGQRQRIGIARALYRDPTILVLDEATSALDNETEREITRAIRDLSGSKTVILIAHRLSTITHCDQIIFLVDGTVRACGTYETLVRDCEEFKFFASAAQA